MTAEFHAPDIFTISGVFSKSECDSLIQRAEEIGFSSAEVRTKTGSELMTNIRNNDRVNFQDSELAQLMWSRVSDVLPVLDGKHAVGTDDRLRFYRYAAGQQFRRHKDGSVSRDDGCVSQLSYLIYLNDDFEGGETKFREYSGTGASRRKRELTISPVTGSALLFQHERWHEGVVLTAGRKYVLRSDVFYGS